jgi:hypothetical protein
MMSLDMKCQGKNPENRSPLPAIRNMLPELFMIGLGMRGHTSDVRQNMVIDVSEEMESSIIGS